MNKITWNSQPVDKWRRKYAPGKFIDLSGHITHYIEKGDGRPVILLHGWFHDSEMWSRNIDALAKSFKVYTIDLWGFGYSTREILDWGYPLYSEQLLKFMDTLGIGKASLIGQSMGGGTAILFCTQHRERVDKMVLVASGGMPNPPFLATRITCLPHIGEFLFHLGCTGFLPLGYLTPKGILKSIFIHNEKSIANGFFEELTRFHQIRGTTETLLSSLRKDFFDKLLPEINKLGEMEVPILVVWGRHDRAIRLKLGQEMHKILRSSRLEIFEDAAHCPNYEQAEKFNDIVISFLT